jgi:uncharacterized protein (DUF433 family)
LTQEKAGDHFMDTSVQQHYAYVSGTRLNVWMVIQTHRLLGAGDQATADYFEISLEAVREATRYAAAYPAEIEHDIERNEAAYERGLRSEV